MKTSNQIDNILNHKYVNHLHKLDTNIWELKKSYQPDMNVPGKLFLSPNLLTQLDAKSIEQIANVASLPGIVGSSLAMPDVHVGYGFTIGGVAAFDPENGVAIPGGVGFDINCGVRLIKTNLIVEDFLMYRDLILNQLFSLIPSGIGGESNIRITNSELEEILLYGSKSIVDKGFGVKNDLLYCEEMGFMKGGELKHIGKKSYQRGKKQLGTLGSGNHFLEIQYVDEIYNEKTASIFGIFKNQVCIMIHCGSRGFGHQVCTDHIYEFNNVMSSKYNINVKDPELSCVPINSKEANNYFGSMICGANYAWANRQIITNKIRDVFETVYRQDFDSLGMELVYDISHNIVKKENHKIDSKYKELYIYRKGATRSLPPLHSDIPKKYSYVGQPVLIPGSMGTPSYILSGGNNSMNLTFGSACHGSGRIMGRSEAIKTIDTKQVISKLLEQDIIIKSDNFSLLSSESPDVYKSSNEVVNIVDQLNIANKVAKLTPLGVIKG